MNDKYATALERALYNWYYGENGSDPEPVFNAMSQGAEKGMQCLIPIETPQELLQQLLEAESLQDGASFTINEELPISFQHLVVDEEGHYLIPIFTSSEQLNIGGEGRIKLQMAVIFAICLVLLRKKWNPILVMCLCGAASLALGLTGVVPV